MHGFTPEDNAALGHFVRRFTLPRRRGSAPGPETGQSLNYARAVRIPEETDAAATLRYVLDQRMGGYPAQRVVLAGKLVR